MNYKKVILLFTILTFAVFSTAFAEIRTQGISGDVTLSQPIPSGNNVENAIVEFYQGTTLVDQTSPTEFGHYEMSLLPGTYTVAVNADALPDYFGDIIDDVIVYQDQVTTGVDFFLLQPPGIKGEVFLVGGSGNVEDVEIKAESDVETFIFHPDSDGSYRKAGMPPGIYTVTYLLNDYKEVIIPDVDLTVTPAVIEDLGTTELFAYAYVEGHITLVNGVGDPEDVEFVFEETDTGITWFPIEVTFYNVQSLEADYTAKFEVDAEIISLTEHAELSGYFNSENIPVLLEAGETYEALDLTLLYIPFGWIEGNIALVGGTGNVQDVELIVYDADGFEIEPLVEPTIDAYGDYVIEMITGVFSVEASLLYYAPSTIEDIVVISGQHNEGNDFILESAAPAYLEGTVTLNGTGIVEDVTITATHPVWGTFTEHPDPFGYYHMDLLAPDGPTDYEVTAELTDFFPADTTVTLIPLEITEWNPQLGPACTISGTVTLLPPLDPTGCELDSIVVQLLNLNLIEQQRVTMDSPGLYQFFVGEGTYVVRATKIGYSIEMSTVTASQTPATFSPDLEPLSFGFIAGKVDTNDGSLLDDVILQLAGTIYEGICDTLEYSWANLIHPSTAQPDSYEVKVFVPNDEPSTSAIVSAKKVNGTPAFPESYEREVLLGATTPDIDFIFNPSIEGTVTLNIGHGNVQTVIILANDITRNPDQNGYYFFPAFPAGDYTVTATLQNYYDSVATVTVNPPSTTPHNIVLVPKDATISGKVTLNGGCGDDIEEVVVTADGVSDNCDAQGNYSLTIDMEGHAITWDVTVTAVLDGYYDVDTEILDITENVIYPNTNLTLNPKPGWIAGNIQLFGGGGISLLPLPDSTLNLWVGHINDPMQLHTTMRPLSGYSLDYVTNGISVDGFFPPDNKFNLAGQVWGYVFDNTLPNIESIDVCNNDTTFAQDFQLESVRIMGTVVVPHGSGNVIDVSFIVENAAGNTITPYNDPVHPDADGSYAIDVDPSSLGNGLYSVTAILDGYSDEPVTKTITNIDLPDYQHSFGNDFNMDLLNPEIEEFYVKQDSEVLEGIIDYDNVSVYQNYYPAPETRLPIIHAKIVPSVAAEIDTVLFEYVWADSLTDPDWSGEWINIHTFDGPEINDIYEYVWSITNPFVSSIRTGQYAIKVTAWDNTVTRSVVQEKTLDAVYVRNVLLDYDGSNLTYSTEDGGPNTGNNILHNSEAALTVAVLGTPDDISQVDSLKIDVVNRDGGAILTSVTKDNPYFSETEWTWYFSNTNFNMWDADGNPITTDYLLAAAGIGADHINIDFNVALWDTTDANWVWYDTPLYEDIWIDAQDPVLPGYDKVSISKKTSGEQIDITDLILPSNTTIEVKLVDCFDELTHIDNVDLLSFYPGYLNLDDDDFDIDAANSTITFDFWTEYGGPIYWFEFEILVDDWINDNPTTKTYRFISEELLAQMDAYDYNNQPYPFLPEVVWTDHLERDYWYRTVASDVNDCVVNVDFYKVVSPEGFDGGLTADWGQAFGSDNDAPYNVEKASYDSTNAGPPTPPYAELFKHNQYYEFIGFSKIHNAVDLVDHVLGIDEIKGSAIYDIDFNNSWTEFKNAGYVKRIKYKDDTTHNLPDVSLEGIYGDPGEIIQISPDEFIVNKEVGGEWIDEVRIDDDTIPWDIINPYEYFPYGVGKIQYYYSHGVADDNLIATVYGPDFSLYDWNISMLEEGEYEVYALGIDNVNNTQTQIHSLYITIKETASTWISDLAGFPVEDIYYNGYTLHGDTISITAKSNGTIDGFRFYASPDPIFTLDELLPDGVVLQPDSVCTYKYWDVAELSDGPYWVGSTSLEDIEPPHYGVQITIDNTLDFAPLEEQSIVDNDILGDSTVIVLKHRDIDDLAPAATIEYRNMAPDSLWKQIGTFDWDCLTGTITDTLDQNVPNWNEGFYQFRIMAEDLAIPEPGNADTLIFAQDIRFDSAAPIITDFAVVQNGFEYQWPDSSVNISAGDPVAFKLFADDQCESGITHAMILLAYDGNWGEQIIILDETYDSAPDIEELVDFDLSAYPLGEYSIKIVLEDIVNSDEFGYAFTLLSPDMIPEPIIAGFDFKENTDCKDRIYAYTKACYLPNGSQIPATGIRFEYTIDGGTNWIDMGTTITEVDTSASGNEKLYRVDYNVAEIELIRPVAYLEIADSIYSKIGVPVDPADYTAFSQMTADGLRIVADDVAKVGSASPVDFIIALSEELGDDNCDNDEAEIVELSSNNNTYAGEIVIANPGEIGANSGTVSLWMYNADGLSYSTMNVHKVTPSFGSNGIVTSYDAQMTATIPANCVTSDNAVWFEPNEEYYPTNNEMLTQVSVTEKVIYYGGLPSIPDQLPVYTLAYDPVLVPAEAFLEVYWYDLSLNVWDKVDDAIFNDIEAEFSTPIVGNFAVFANSCGILNLAVDDIEIDPVFNNYTTTSPDFWTVVTYQGMQSDLLLDVILNGYYLVEDNQTGPAPCEVDWDWCGIDEVNHILHIYGIEDLEPETEYTLEIVITDIYENEDSSEIIFNIDDVAPVVSNATYEGLTFSAEITDALTEVADVVFEVAGLVKTLDQMTVAGDTYSYTFSYAELADALGDPFGFLTAVWTAYDALYNYETYEFSYDYVLTYSITFEAFNGSFWYNPTLTNEFFFNVNIPEGVVIANGGVIVDFEIGGSTVQENTMATALGENRYKVNYGGNYPPTATAITLIAEVTTTDGPPFDAQQNYGIDYGAPSVWAISPIGDPIDNDNDGLYNEDWPDGINQDQDYDDLNHNGVWDWDDINGNGIWDLYLYSYVTPCDTLCYWVEEPGEPGIVDEDPIDFLSPEMPYGTEVVISIGFNDVPMYIANPDTSLGYYYTAASGINTEGIDLLLNGVLINSEDYYVSNGVLVYAAGKLEASHYVITAIIPDLAGNVGTTWVGQNANPWQFEFDIKAPAPTVDFQPLLVGGTETWIVQPYDDMQNLFRFSVNWGGNAEIVPNEVNITFIEQSTEAILDGPRTILADSTNGTMAFYSEYLGSNVIDELTPGIILEVEATNIWDASSVSRHTYMIMHSPELSFALPSEMIYSENPLRLGNGSKGITSFPLSLTRDAYVTVEIYNFAGKKVRVLKSNELVKRLTANHVTWDGTNDNGQEVARGGYVTRIVATGVSGDVQGKKIVEMLKIGVVK